MGAAIVRGWIWHVCVCLIQLSLCSLVMGALWLPIDAKLWPDYWTLTFSVCIGDIVAIVTL